MEVLLIWVGLSFVAASIANNKGRSYWGFFFLSILLTPLIGILAAAAAGKDHTQIEKQSIQSGKGKKCPQCAEIIKIEAVKCRFCGSEI